MRHMKHLVKPIMNRADSFKLDELIDLDFENVESKYDPTTELYEKFNKIYNPIYKLTDINERISEYFRFINNKLVQYATIPERFTTPKQAKYINKLFIRSLEHNQFNPHVVLSDYLQKFPIDVQNQIITSITEEDLYAYLRTIREYFNNSIILHHNNVLSDRNLLSYDKTFLVRFLSHIKRATQTERIPQSSIISNYIEKWSVLNKKELARISSSFLEQSKSIEDFCESISYDGLLFDVNNEDIIQFVTIQYIERREIIPEYEAILQNILNHNVSNRCIMFVGTMMEGYHLIYKGLINNSTMDHVTNFYKELMQNCIKEKIAGYFRERYNKEINQYSFSSYINFPIPILRKDTLGCVRETFVDVYSSLLSVCDIDSDIKPSIVLKITKRFFEHLSNDSLRNVLFMPRINESGSFVAPVSPSAPSAPSAPVAPVAPVAPSAAGGIHNYNSGRLISIISTGAAGAVGIYNLKVFIDILTVFIDKLSWYLDSIFLLKYKSAGNVVLFNTGKTILKEKSVKALKTVTHKISSLSFKAASAIPGFTEVSEFVNEAISLAKEIVDTEPVITFLTNGLVDHIMAKVTHSTSPIDIITQITDPAAFVDNILNYTLENAVENFVLYHAPITTVTDVSPEVFAAQILYQKRVLMDPIKYIKTSINKYVTHNLYNNIKHIFSEVILPEDLDEEDEIEINADIQEIKDIQKYIKAIEIFQDIENFEIIIDSSIKIGEEKFNTLESSRLDEIDSAYKIEPSSLQYSLYPEGSYPHYIQQLEKYNKSTLGFLSTKPIVPHEPALIIKFKENPIAGITFVDNLLKNDPDPMLNYYKEVFKKMIDINLTYENLNIQLQTNIDQLKHSKGRILEEVEHINSFKLDQVKPEYIYERISSLPINYPLLLINPRLVYKGDVQIVDSVGYNTLKVFQQILPFNLNAIKPELIRMSTEQIGRTLINSVPTYLDNKYTKYDIESSEEPVVEPFNKISPEILTQLLDDNIEIKKDIKKVKKILYDKLKSLILVLKNKKIDVIGHKNIDKLTNADLNEIMDNINTEMIRYNRRSPVGAIAGWFNGDYTNLQLLKSNIISYNKVKSNLANIIYNINQLTNNEVTTLDTFKKINDSLSEIKTNLQLNLNHSPNASILSTIGKFLVSVDVPLGLAFQGKNKKQKKKVSKVRKTRDQKNKSK